MPRTDPSQPRTILSIDDDPMMLRLFKMTLEPEGYVVAGAFGGHEGLDMMKKMLPDVLLLDLMMPDMDGWQVYEAMLAAELTYKIPVIIVSAKPQPDPGKDVIYSVTRPAGYITKPFDPAVLVTTIKKVLGD